MFNRIRLLLAMAITGLIMLSTVAPATAIEPGTSAFDRTWSRTDRPVAETQVSRTWMWGPSAFSSAMSEYYEEAPGEYRVVQYFDKTRMEISTDPAADPNSPWYVTNGLLARELVTGQMQYGDTLFVDLLPAEVNVAGDANDANGPTYASFSQLLGASPAAEGAVLSQRLDRAGTVTDDPALVERNVQAAHFVPETNHVVAAPFWEFMNAEGVVYELAGFQEARLFDNPFFATGFPISEAYWATVLVGGTPRDVLIQVFERRVLTFTPENGPGWQVEAGNVGQHYFRWRYDADIPSEPPAVTLSDYQHIGPVTPPDLNVDNQGMVTLRFGNNAPHVMVVEFSGPETARIAIPACEECIVFPNKNSFTGCWPQIEWKELTLPPGNYKVEISWPGSNARAGAGPQTYVPNADYGVCWAIIKGL